MSKQSKFWDKVADRYSQKPVADEATYQKKLQVNRDYFQPDMKVFEFGCGTGSTAIVHAPYVKCIRAIDISSRMIEIAQGKADTTKVDNVTFECGAIDDLAGSDETYDAVLGFSILHLLKDRDAAIARVYRMLKPGGFFASSTACLGDRMKFFKLIGPVGKFLGLLPLVKVFSAQQLQDSLIRAGFEIDYQWRPEKAVSVFIVARKAG